MAGIVLGITGASGTVYATRLAQRLHRANKRVEMILTDPAEQVMRFEKQKELLRYAHKVHAIDNFFSPPASGSAAYEAMVIIPCSMGTLGKVANGSGDNLLTRAADVFLKESRPIIFVPREMPFSTIHLTNMKTLVEAGAIMMPASPHFYNDPQTIEEVIDTVVDRILDRLGVDDGQKRWGQGQDLM